MPQLVTPHFGTLCYEEGSVIHFPAGMPAFEHEDDFLIIEQEETAPVVFLQSVRTPELVFMTLPLAAIEPNYQWALMPEDLSLLATGADEPIDTALDLVALAVVTVAEGRVTANIMAPIVIHPQTRYAVQAVQPESSYSLQHPVGVIEEGSC